MKRHVYNLAGRADFIHELMNMVSGADFLHLDPCLAYISVNSLRPVNRNVHVVELLERGLYGLLWIVPDFRNREKL
jgi:hypothetical protein